MRVALVDIGGTAVKTALCDGGVEAVATPVLSRFQEQRTRASEGGEGIFAQVAAMVEGYGPVDAVGVATAGQVDPESGGIRYANPNIPGYTGFPLRRRLAERFSVPAVVENDVNAAALGEARFGAGRPFGRFLCLTYGTGVGGAIVAGGELERGARGAAGEFGMAITRADRWTPDDPLRGRYETYASAAALVREARAFDPTLASGRVVFERRGEPCIAALLERWEDEIVFGLVSLIHAFDPEAVLLGGGIMEQPELVAAVRAKTQARVMPSFSDVELRACELGNAAALYGMLHAVLALRVPTVTVSCERAEEKEKISLSDSCGGIMTDLKAFHGVIPAFYACYDEAGDFSEERTQRLAGYLLGKGVNGLYVGGSSGECIYRSADERKRELDVVVEAIAGKIPIIAHIAAPSTRESVELARHAEKAGVSAISAIPPIYFVLPDRAIAEYWGAMIEATSLPFIIYNIPGTTHYSLTQDLFRTMLHHKQVIGLKNSSMPVQDIERFRRIAGENFVIFNGPDEQYVAGRLMGADAGIGGTYTVMPELFLAAERAITAGDTKRSREIQHAINDVIFLTITCKGSLYSVYKEILKRRGCCIGQVRAPLPRFTPEDEPIIQLLMDKIDWAISLYA